MADKLIECPQCGMLVVWKGRHGSSVNLEIHLNDRGSVCTETWAVLSPEEIIADCPPNQKPLPAKRRLPELAPPLDREGHPMVPLGDVVRRRVHEPKFGEPCESRPAPKKKDVLTNMTDLNGSESSKPKLNKTQVVDLYLRRIEKSGSTIGRNIYPLEYKQASFSHAMNMMDWAYKNDLITASDGDPYAGTVNITEKGINWLEKFGSEHIAVLASDFEIEKLSNE